MYQSTLTNIKNSYQCLQHLLLSPRASSVTHTQFRISLCRHRTPPWLGTAAWSHHVDSPPSPPHAGRPVPPRLCPGYQPAVTDVALHRSTPKAAPDPTTHAGPPAASVMRPPCWPPLTTVVGRRITKGDFFLIWLNLGLSVVLNLGCLGLNLGCLVLN
jgi:hypothetical protein